MRIFILAALFALSLNLWSQSSRLITGSVVDAAKGNALPFVALSLKKNLSGTISNEEGRFEFFVPADLKLDTLQISSFGYKRTLIPLSAVEGPLTIFLQENIQLLKEIDVRPLPPDFYVLQALRRFPKNYPSQPFQALAYYREKLLENKLIVQENEGVFKTYCPNFTDTVQNQDQLLLYRQAEQPAQLQFMKKERDKAAEKENKTGKKSNSGVDIDLAGSFSGPSSVLAASKLNKDNANFLDSTKLSSYVFKFAKPNTYDQAELMVIQFKSKGKVEHLREEGTLFIDRNSLAIVRIENAGDFVVPILLRPILFLYGIGIDNPTYTKTVSFQQVEGQWYPGQVWNEVNIEMTRRHLFSKNEHSRFEIEQAYVVNKLRIEKAKPIPPEYRMKDAKELEKSVHNDENLNWESVNKIKKKG